jgi:AraC family transcriptional regulator, regulatory protein of adaptative response / DNA-3-methyladenine glycosylase II
MTLDMQLCSRARLARDARFDGKFYIAVLTTRIYCRPICRSRTSQEKNVRYFPSAAAAAEAGFRPCLRCRPECAPGTPAWAGTKTTVSRALRLINETGLEEGGVEALAGHLGLGSRHLRRLFLKHLGATPSAVAQTRRLHFAKKLIDETRLTMTQIAIASGFGSVRRFNAHVSKVYRRTPTQLRDLAPQKGGQADRQYVFRLDFRPPYAWKRMLAVLAAEAIPGVEVVDRDSYRRSISTNGVSGYLEVTIDESRDALNVRVQIGEPRALFLIVERVRAMFDLNADWATIERTLKTDPALAARITADPGLRVAGCWDGFEIATRAILRHQTNATRARDLAGRLVKTFGSACYDTPGVTHFFPGADILATADLESAGLPKARSEAIRVLAQAVRDGRISFERIADPDAVAAQLSKMPGFPAAAVQYVAMRALREPDAFPVAGSDLVRTLALSDPAELEQRSRAWRPWRAYAVAYLCEPPQIRISQRVPRDAPHRRQRPDIRRVPPELAEDQRMSSSLHPKSLRVVA